LCATVFLEVLLELVARSVFLADVFPEVLANPFLEILLAEGVWVRGVGGVGGRDSIFWF